MPKRYSTRGVERVLLSRGFSKLGQRGSHVKYGDGEHVVIVVRLSALNSINARRLTHRPAALFSIDRNAVLLLFCIA